MNPCQLKETTMDPATRSMIKITLPGQYEQWQAGSDIVDRSASALDEEAIDA